MRDELQALRRCLDACERWIERGDSGGEKTELPAPVRDLVTKTTTALEVETSGQPTARDDGEQTERSRTPGRRGGQGYRTLLWSLLYILTIATLVVWYEFWPVWNVQQQLQGAWQYTTGFSSEERLEDSYFQVNGRETWLTYPFRQKWQAQRSRIRIRPANDFFIVRREFGFKTVNTRETEYIMRLVDGKLYLVRGMARLDAMRERKIEKLRRIEQLPEVARAAIEASR